MRAGSWLRVACGLVWLSSSGCSALAELPRAEQADGTRHKNVEVITVDGLRYDLDSIEIKADSLIGYRRRDVEGPFDDFAVVRLGQDEVAHVYARRLDWLRTSLVVGGAAATVAVIGLAASNKNSNNGSTSGGGKGGGVP
jgi:hypothetical protein